MSTHVHQRPSLWYALPAFTFFGLFAALPMVLVLYLSLTSWRGLETPEFLGLDNWARLLTDTAARDSLVRTVLFTVLAWAVQTPVALLIGVWSAGSQRNRAVLGATFFVPLLLSTAAIALLWQSLLNPNFGIPQAFGALSQLQFLGDPDIALYTVVFVLSWQYIPFHALLYQGAARNIPVTMYDAAIIDGASRFGRFRFITLPQLRYTVVTSSVLMIVGTLTTFDTVLILTGGGPGTATRIAPLYMYDTGFVAFEMGYASTIAVLLLVFGTAVSLLLMRVTKFREMQSQQEGQ
jgi:xylobiose transport system permease protein